VWRHARSAHCSGTHVTATRARADARTGMRDVCTTRGEGAGLQHALEPRGTSTRALLLCVYVCACVLPRVCAIWTRQACAHFERHAHLRASATRMMPYGGMDYVCVCRSPCESCAVLQIAGDRHLTDQFFVLQPFFCVPVVSVATPLVLLALLFRPPPPTPSSFCPPTRLFSRCVPCGRVTQSYAHVLHVLHARMRQCASCLSRSLCVPWLRLSYACR